MSLDVLGIKNEALKPPPLLCHACFSVDRTLWPVGNLLNDFYSLVQLRSTPSSVCLCWECLAVLRRLNEFKRNVSTVQGFLQQYRFNQSTPVPSPLTRLSATRPSDDVTVIQLHQEAQSEAVVKEEVVAVPLLMGFDLKEETDDTADTANHCWQNQIDESDHKDIATTPITLRQKKPSNRKVKAKKYKTTLQTNVSVQKMYKKVQADSVEVQVLLEQDRKDEGFLQYPYRCEHCVRGWRSEGKLVEHNEKHHSKCAGAYRCPGCARRACSEGALAQHKRVHLHARRCRQCAFTCAAAARMRRHVLGAHLRTVQCRYCEACFHNVREFFDHYKALHRVFICDKCGKKYASRASIKRHLSNHGPFVCQLCSNQVFKTRDSLGAHNRLKHSSLSRPELAYCVECDRQFESVRAYRMHLADNDAHRKNARKRSFPCPSCGKVYARNAYMRAHHNLVHLKRTDFCCRECDASFVNRAQYVLHVKMKHEGYTRPKNKLCPICGRGFTRNWYLRNHLRTHTGERPFACAHCDASFGQRAAMKAHVRHIHLKAK